MSPILARTAEIQSYVVSKATIATITTEGVAEAVRSSADSEAADSEAADSEAVAEALAAAASAEEWEAVVEPVHDSDPYR